MIKRIDQTKCSLVTLGTGDVSIHATLNPSIPTIIFRPLTQNLQVGDDTPKALKDFEAESVLIEVTSLESLEVLHRAINTLRRYLIETIA